MEATPDRDSEGFFSGLVNKYDELWKTIIMPTRTKYNLEHLGPEMRRIGDDGVYARKDCQKTNLRGEKLEVTVFSRSPQVTTDKQFMVYLHSHGGSRVEGLGLLPFAWELGMDFCVFDFSGSGMSEGAYTTLGMRESEDCAAVIELLQRDFGATRFVLWGRSMGAVAAILYASGRLPHIRALVLDTPFSTVEAMVRDAGDSYAPLGQYLASFLFGLVKEEIKSKIGQDLSVFSPILTCSKCNLPAIFLAASNDKLVPSVRIEEQFHLWGGSPKEILKIQGSHSSSREADQIRTVIERLKVILDKSMHSQPSKQDGQGQFKHSLALGPQKPKTWDQKENIRPSPSMVARDDSSPRIHQGSPRTGSQLHQRHMSHIPISSIRREPDQAAQMSPSVDQQGQPHHNQTVLKEASNGVDGEGPKPKDPMLAQNLESITENHQFSSSRTDYSTDPQSWRTLSEATTEAPRNINF